MAAGLSKIVVVLLGTLLYACDCVQAQSRIFVGVLGGASTLSADGEAQIGQSTTSVSLYSPENGPALNLLGGVHFNDFLSLQGNYVWNRNQLTLTSTLFSDAGQVLYQQRRISAQHGVLGDLLLYFRSRHSRFRPYLSVGSGMVHFTSKEDRLVAIRGAPKLPPENFTSTQPALRVAVGTDLAWSRGWAFRYSFSETLRGNPISAQLSPPGQRNLANFQNLFGLIKTF